MHRLFKILALVVVVVGSCNFALAQAVITIAFDDISSFSQPGENYASLGVHFGTGPFGLVAGITNGDPGNWSVDGTNGPYFLGFNGTPSYSEGISFDTPTSGVSIDVSRTNGSSPTDTFKLTAYAGATQVAEQIVTLSTINVWQTVSVFATGITKIEIFGDGLGFHPYGVDNLKIGITPVPEPATWVLLALGLPGLCWLRRRMR